MKGLLLLGGGRKDMGEDAEPMSKPSDGVEHTFAREAFAALKDDDEEGFVSAFLGAVRACAAKSSSEGEYEDDEA